MATKAKKKKGYFLEKEEQAVVDYITSKSADEKNRIFTTILYPALSQMVEAIIKRYRMHIPGEEYEETFVETLSYVTSKLEKYDVTTGYKAYSYIGTVCRNYLRQKFSQYMKKQSPNVSYDDMSESLNNDIKHSTYKINENNSASELIESAAREISKMIEKPELNCLNDNEIKVGRALVALLNHWQEIFSEGTNKFQKSEVLYYLRESTMMDTKAIRANMRKYKVVYEILKDIILKS